VYLVLHADPAIDAQLDKRWTKLERFMSELEQRNAELEGSGHHVSIMLTPNWGKLISKSESKQLLVGSWMAAGHEMAFHSHSHTHQFRDGYSNATDFPPDDLSLCDGDAAMGECSLDAGVQAVQKALESAAGGSYDIKFARIGPEGNGGDPPLTDHDNTCKPAASTGPNVADEAGCINAEWTGQVNALVRYSTDDYPGVTEKDTDQASSLLGSSFCNSWGDAEQDIYTLPHAPYETESGRLRVELPVVRDAVKMAGSEHFISVVIHPMSYDDSPGLLYTGNRRERILELLDFLDGEQIQSRTLSEIRDADDSGIDCKDAR